jgi:hypothetical protein
VLESVYSAASDPVADVETGFSTTDWTPQQVALFKQMEEVAVEQQTSRHSTCPDRPRDRARLPKSRRSNRQFATDPFILYNMNSHPSALYQSWHNSDGSSGHYVPNPGGVRGGAFFNGNGEIDQYVPYPGGNGGTIFHANGTITNIDPQIGGY